MGLPGYFFLCAFQLVPLPSGVLAWLSPETARLSSELLPKTPEILAFGEVRDPCPLPAGDAISIYPGATRRQVVRLLAVFFLFAVVRNNVATPAATRRLAVAVLVNGTLLALFAFLQFFSSLPKTVYWTYPVLVAPFGPFLNRDHYAFYLNMCVGMGGGVLLSLLSKQPRPQGSRLRERRAGAICYDSADEESKTGAFFKHLQSPAVHWGVVALVFMIGSVFFSQSRGGILSLTLSLVVVFLPQAFTNCMIPAAAMVLLIAVGLLLVLFGFDPANHRLSTLWTGEAFQDLRLSAWKDVLPSVKDFPLVGTGYGTFLDVELMCRTRPGMLEEGWEHAHNDYLEALIEGGAIRLALSLFLIVWVYRVGWRALRRYQGSETHGLVLGALLAFTTVVIHGVVDFGLHIPAIAVFATVLVVHLCALGSPIDPSQTDPAGPGGAAWAGRMGGAVAVVAAVALGSMLCVEGRRLARSYALEVAARVRGARSGTAGSSDLVARTGCADDA